MLNKQQQSCDEMGGDALSMVLVCHSEASAVTVQYVFPLEFVHGSVQWMSVEAAPLLYSTSPLSQDAGNILLLFISVMPPLLVSCLLGRLLVISDKGGKIDNYFSCIRCQKVTFQIFNRNKLQASHCKHNKFCSLVYTSRLEEPQPENQTACVWGGGWEHNP